MKLSQEFEKIYGAPPAAVCSAAGRVNLIGEHVDYCGGEVLPAALSLGCRVAVRPNGTHLLRLAATTLGERAELDLGDLGAGRAMKWWNYQAGVAYMLKEAGYRVVGCDLLYDCSVPFGAGLSSSAAIEVATAYAIAMSGGNPIDKTQLALLCCRAENEFCKVGCGVMDQFVSAHGKRGNAILLDCSTLRFRYIPLDLGDCMLVLADSNQPHALAAAGTYQKRRAETDEALRILSGALPIRCLAQASAEQLEGCRSLLSPVIYRRARHVVTECERVRRAVAAIEGGDLAAFGALLNASHLSLREDYEVAGEGQNVLAEAAQARPECLGSRMTGAGFGGCTVSLVRRAEAENFAAHVGEIYRERMGREATFYFAEIADGIAAEELA